MPEINSQINENVHDKDLRELQDEALKTPGYHDDPHIASSNRLPKNDDSKTQETADQSRESAKEDLQSREN